MTGFIPVAQRIVELGDVITTAMKVANDFTADSGRGAIVPRDVQHPVRLLDDASARTRAILVEVRQERILREVRIRDARAACAADEERAGLLAKVGTAEVDADAEPLIRAVLRLEADIATWETELVELRAEERELERLERDLSHNLAEVARIVANQEHRMRTVVRTDERTAINTLVTDVRDALDPAAEQVRLEEGRSESALRDAESHDRMREVRGRARAEDSAITERLNRLRRQG